MEAEEGGPAPGMTREGMIGGQRSNKNAKPTGPHKWQKWRPCASSWMPQRPKPPKLASSVAVANQPSSSHEQERNRKLSGDLAISRALAESGLKAQASERLD